jgi:HAMP domain-containing protein
MNPEQIQATVERWVQEVIELRFGAGEDPEGSLPTIEPQHPDEAIHLLSRVRARADRVEELESSIRRLRGRLRRQQFDAQLEAEVKRDEAFVTNRATKVMDFVSADEKRADAALASIEEKRAAIAAQRLVDYVQEAFDVVDQARWGLSAYRQDLRAQLHGLQVVRSQEYSSAGPS